MESGYFQVMIIDLMDILIIAHMDLKFFKNLFPHISLSINFLIACSHKRNIPTVIET